MFVLQVLPLCLCLCYMYYLSVCVTGITSLFVFVLHVLSPCLCYRYYLSVLQVFAVDWSPDGQRVASGGKDRVLKMLVFLCAPF